MAAHPHADPLTARRLRDPFRSRDDDETPSPAARAEARRGLYVHVPFCAVRCAYCDFSSGALSSHGVERYLAGIEREARRRAPEAAGFAFTSVFFGGGTPSALSARQLGRLARTLWSHFDVAADAEITLEANPESVRPERLDAWRAAGVNRLSLGAQSFHAEELARLGRAHDAGRPAEAVRLARAHGFQRLSLDLMFGFPGHTGAAFATTLERALELEPEHLSAYCFIPERGTTLGDDVLRRRVALPTPAAQADLYGRLAARLAGAGYRCYETSNFCRPGGEARHNLVYWLRREYLGLGPSAHGLWRGVRYGNHHATARWAESLEAGRPCDEREPETPASRADETVLLGLRLAHGVRAADHSATRWREVSARFGAAFDAAVAGGRLTAAPDGVRIDARHRFVADDIIAWVLARAEERTPRPTRRNGAVPQLTAARRRP